MIHEWPITVASPIPNSCDRGISSSPKGASSSRGSSRTARWNVRVGARQRRRQTGSGADARPQPRRACRFFVCEAADFLGITGTTSTADAWRSSSVLRRFRSTTCWRGRVWPWCSKASAMPTTSAACFATPPRSAPTSCCSVPTCCDPLYRKAIRTSMGASLARAVRSARVSGRPRCYELRAAGFSLVALTPREPSEPIDTFASRPRAPKLALLVGAEGRGPDGGCRIGSGRSSPHSDCARHRLAQPRRRDRHRARAPDSRTRSAGSKDRALRTPVQRPVFRPVPALHSRFHDQRNPAPEESRMQILIIWLVAAVAAMHTSSINEGLTRSESVMVRAVDRRRDDRRGDDRPSSPAWHRRARRRGAPFAREARERLTALVLRRWMRLEHQDSANGGDRSHRAYVVRDDGLFVNAVLVREGLARVERHRGLSRGATSSSVRRRRRDCPAAEYGAARRRFPARVILTARPTGDRRRPRPGNTRKTRPTSAQTQDINTRGRHTRRVRFRTQDSRAQQALLPFQSLADLDFRLLHRAGSAHLRSLRARLRLIEWRSGSAPCIVGDRHRRPSRRAAGRRAEAVHHPLHRRSAESAVPPRLLHLRLERGDHLRRAEHHGPGHRDRHRRVAPEARFIGTRTFRSPDRFGCSARSGGCRA